MVVSFRLHLLSGCRPDAVADHDHLSVLKTRQDLDLSGGLQTELHFANLDVVLRE